MRPPFLLPILAGALLPMGCGTPDVRPVAGDVYVLSSSASRYSTGKREDLIRQANAYAESRGKVAVAVPQPGTLSGIDRGGVVEYRFRLVDKDSAGAPAASPAPQPAAMPQPAPPATPSAKAEKPAPAGQGPKAPKLIEPGEGNDLYSELIKLDDLRKRGILTEEEFQAQKKKLLEGPQK